MSEESIASAVNYAQGYLQGRADALKIVKNELAIIEEQGANKPGLGMTHYALRIVAQRIEGLEDFKQETK